jgi:hypothetical protein
MDKAKEKREELREKSIVSRCLMCDGEATDFEVQSIASKFIFTFCILPFAYRLTLSAY